MSKVTSKYQVSIPKALAERYRLKPGDEIDFEEAGPVIRIVPPQARRPPLDLAERLRLFDEATARQDAREDRDNIPYAIFDPARRERGWTRADLYDRGASDGDADSSDE
ncbi:MAG: AbrB/MazE/SpoVT family DNA-binding domain-containing protein [Acidobacteriota bacterium]